MIRVKSPYFIFGTISALFILIFSLLFNYYLKLNLIISFIIAINITTFILYGYDKFSAKNGLLRVPEWSLHILGILGGTIAGYLAQKFFRHKTNDTSFRPVYITIFVLQVLILIGFILY